GSESYIGKFQAEGMVVDTQPIGFNRAVLLVAKGNPKNISADMNNFINGQYRTILGASESGSIGRETRLILNSEGFYRKAVAQALFLATDSRKLVTAIEENRADLTINWHAATLSGKNRTLVDILPLDNIVAPPQVLILGLLKTSHHFELTRRFMQLAGSDQRQALLSRYGFGE
ncbi:MAG: substrate-binding domain-containing protein, partial [Thermodesulfobacteriota bacterium]|nr:substrate-binding domain-containing protein [Thermodesulfobacteriota bacterium]